MCAKNQKTNNYQTNIAIDSYNHHIIWVEYDKTHYSYSIVIWVLSNHSKLLYIYDTITCTQSHVFSLKTHYSYSIVIWVLSNHSKLLYIYDTITCTQSHVLS